MFWRKKKEQAGVLLDLGGGDSMTVEEATEGGVIVFGGPGSGKTSSSLANIICNGMRQGLGVCALCVKPDEADRIERYAHRTGRLADVIRFSDKGPWKLDLLNTITSMPGGADNAAFFLDQMLEVGARRQPQGEQSFWKQASHRMIRNAVLPLQAAYGKASISDVADLISDAPRNEVEADPNTEQGRRWREHTECGKCLEAVAKNAQSGTVDTAQAVLFWLKEYARTPEKTRANMEATVMGVLDRFRFGGVSRVFSSGETNAPLHLLGKGKIFLCDFSVMEHNESGLFANVGLKAAVLRYLLGRDVREDGLPVMVLQDEAQLLILEKLDSMAAGVSRSQRIIPVAATQSVPMLVTALGGYNAMQETEGWLGLFQTRILHQNSCHITNGFWSKSIGMKRTLFYGGGTQGKFDLIGDMFGSAQPIANVSFNQQMFARVPMEIFPALLKGGAPHFTAQAIVHRGRGPFKNGEHWKLCEIPQVI